MLKILLTITIIKESIIEDSIATSKQAQESIILSFHLLIVVFFTKIKSPFISLTVLVFLTSFSIIQPPYFYYAL